MYQILTFQNLKADEEGKLFPHKQKEAKGIHHNYISKALNRVWHKSLISKLPSYGFYPFLSIFISSFLYDHSIAVVVYVHCSSPKTINSGVP